MSRSWIVIGITSFQWDFTTGTEDRQEGRREDVKEKIKYIMTGIACATAIAAAIVTAKLGTNSGITVRWDFTAEWEAEQEERSRKCEECKK